MERPRNPNSDFRCTWWKLRADLLTTEPRRPALAPGRGGVLGLSGRSAEGARPCERIFDKLTVTGGGEGGGKRRRGRGGHARGRHVAGSRGARASSRPHGALLGAPRGPLDARAATSGSSPRFAGSSPAATCSQRGRASGGRGEARAAPGDPFRVPLMAQLTRRSNSTWDQPVSGSSRRCC